jgi:predicted phosphodiesterase
MKRKINLLAHLSDIHIPQLDKRHPEFRIVFENTRIALEKETPDLIVVAGDLFHDKLKVSNECMLLAKEFLLMLANIAPVVITRGNHDFASTVKIKKMDCVEALMKLGGLANVTYMDQSGFWLYDNLIFVVWHHGDHYSPWNEIKLPADERNPNFRCAQYEALLDARGSREAIEADGYTYIDLFHDPIRGCSTDAGFVMDGDNYLPLTAFEGDFLLAGDIHKRQLYFK